jgi:dihydrofolate reductase
MISLIVAHDSQRGIGYQNKIPWYIPGEQKWVATTTKKVNDPRCQNALIMGLNTWLSLPPERRPLPGRLTIVISSSLVDDIEGVCVCRSIEDAIDRVNNDPLIETGFIFGGDSIYRQALEHGVVDELLTAEVPGTHEIDTFFPEIPLDFTCISSEPMNYGEFTVIRHHYRK